MDWLVWGTLIALGVFEVRQAKVLAEVRAELKQFHTRQSEIKMQQAFRRNPIVDARARTTTRDTNDLPPTARVGRVLRRRVMVGGDTNDG